MKDVLLFTLFLSGTAEHCSLLE